MKNEMNLYEAPPDKDRKRTRKIMLRFLFIIDIRIFFIEKHDLDKNDLNTIFSS